VRVAGDPELAHLLSGLEHKATSRRGAKEPEAQGDVEGDVEGDGDGDGDGGDADREDA
jgi:hypothetical protein